MYNASADYYANSEYPLASAETTFREFLLGLTGRSLLFADLPELHVHVASLRDKSGNGICCKSRERAHSEREL